jgi:hypothetical protein
MGIEDWAETFSFRLRIEVVGDRDLRVMSRGGLRSDLRATVIERSAPGASFWRFGRGCACFGRIYCAYS